MTTATQTRRQVSLLVSLTVAATFALTGAQIALAVFTAGKVGGPLTVATNTLSAPEGLSATQVNCRSNKAPEIELEWTASSSSYATSYTVERATASAGPYTSVATAALSETSYVDSSSGLKASTMYYYRVSVVYRLWSKSSAYTSVKTFGKSCS